MKMKLWDIVYFATLTGACLPGSRHSLQSVIPRAVRRNNVYKLGASRRPASSPSVT
jgi:hypothetical protein